MQIFIRTELTSFQVEIEPETTWDDLKEKILDSLAREDQTYRATLSQALPYCRFNCPIMSGDLPSNMIHIQSLSQGDVIEMTIPTYFPPRIDFPKLRTVVARQDGSGPHDLSRFILNQSDSENFRTSLDQIADLIQDHEWSACSCRQYRAADMANRYNYPDIVNPYYRNTELIATLQQYRCATTDGTSPDAINDLISQCCLDLSNPQSCHQDQHDIPPETPYREMVWRGPCPHDIICLTMLDEVAICTFQIRDHYAVLGLGIDSWQDMIYFDGIYFGQTRFFAFECGYDSIFPFFPCNAGAKEAFVLMALLMGTHYTEVLESSEREEEWRADKILNEFVCPQWDQIEFSSNIPDL